MDKFTIVGPNSVTWQEYKAIRLLSLQHEPEAEVSRYRKEKSNRDQVWITRLARYQQMKTDYMVFAKFENDRVIGMLGMYQAHHDVKSKTAILMGLYVGREFRGRGVNSRLLEAMLAMLYEHGKIKYARLGVNSEQTETVKLYESFGFTVVDKQRTAYGDGLTHEEYIMEKVIR